MRPRQFVDEVVHVVKKQYPELYLQHMQGRIGEFAEEHKPIKQASAAGVEGGRRVGYVSKDLRLLWAIARMFCDSLPNPQSSKYAANVAGTCDKVDELARNAISRACVSAFWTFIIARFMEGGKWNCRLDGDWSVSLVPIKPGKSGGTVVDLLMGTIYSQANVSDAARKLKRRVERQIAVM